MSGERKKIGAWKWIVCAALLAIGAAAAWKAFPIADWVNEGVRWIEGLGPWGPVAWFLCFAVLGTLSFPTTPLYIGSGVMFGLAGGLLVAFPAGFAASMGSFLIARHLARASWESKLKNVPHFEELMSSLDEGGLKVVILARLSPFIPAAAKNYGLGLTGLPFLHYAAGTAVGQLPIAAAYTYLGWVGGAAVLHGDVEPSRTEIALTGAGAVASIVLLVILTRQATKSLRRSSSGAAPSTG